MDLAGRFDRYRWSESPAKSDNEALGGDWRAVGLDLLTTMETERVRLELRDG